MHTPNLNEMAAAQPHCEIQVEMLPGTEIMVDVDGRSSIHAHNSPSAIVLIPQPTAELDDPLNWSSTWKTMVIIMQGAFVIISIIPALSIAPLTPIYMQEWQKSLTEVALLSGVTVILLGYSNFIIIPCTEIFGKRNTLMVCALINLASTIWCAEAKTYGSFLAARCLMGTGAAANESIMGVVVADIYFLHERGSYVGAYFWCYFMGLFVGPIISGTIANDITWRWFFWVCTIAQGLNIVGLLVLFPETRYLSRKSGTPSSVPSQRDEKDLAAMRLESIPPEQGQLDASLGKERPSRRQFSLLQPLDRNALHDVVRHFLTPIRLFCMPIIFWASMSMGASANALLAVNLLQSQVLAAPPYNFNPAQVGYANFALVGGGAIGLLVAGPWSDWLSARSTRRNGGIREPEMRLPSLFPFIAAALVGLVAFGVGSQNKWPWPAVTIVGLGLAGVQVVAIPTIVITYAIDSYKPVTREIMVIMTVIKNTFGFGMTYYINDWAAADGFIPPMMLLMAMTVGLTLAGTIFFMLYGKTCRRWTRNSKIHHF